MKKLLRQYYQCEKTYKIEAGIDNIFSLLTKNEKIVNKMINNCQHQTKNGKTIILILKKGLIELHEILSKNIIYMNVTIRDEKEFNKIKKELEGIENGII